MRELIGPDARLWSVAPQMALVLMCSIPSGSYEVVVLRELISEQLRLPPVLGSRSLRPAVVHADRPVGQDASRLVYVGCGRNDPQSRPSVFFKPFFFLCQSDAVANRLYGEWLSARMDLEFFLQPLLGMSLLCDCDRGVGCHVHILLRVLDRVFPLPGHASHILDLLILHLIQCCGLLLI